jgi:DNA repair exonuclease SbcCD ATPase subunit
MSDSQPILYETEYDISNVQVTPEIVEEIEIHDKSCECVSCVNEHKANIKMIKEDIDGYIQKRNDERDAYIQKMNDERDAYVQKFKKEWDDIILVQDEQRKAEQELSKLKEQELLRLKYIEQELSKLKEQELSKLKEQQQKTELLRLKYIEQYNKYNEIQYQCDKEYHNLIKISEEYYSMENKYTYNMMPKNYYPIILPTKFTIHIGGNIITGYY